MSAIIGLKITFPDRIAICTLLAAMKIQAVKLKVPGNDHDFEISARIIHDYVESQL